MKPEVLRQRLVDSLRAKGLTDETVLAALGAVPRHAFVPTDLSGEAYDDCALPIGDGATISQPYVVALMTSAARLSPKDRVLEVGTGSGYGAAVLSHLCAHVDSIERNQALADGARTRLTRLGFHGIDVFTGDGTLGLHARAPFDCIIVTAGGPKVPEGLLWQLAPGGRLVMPVGNQDHQTLVRITRGPEGFRREDLSGVRFVPLVGRHGWGGDVLPKD